MPVLYCNSSRRCKPLRVVERPALRHCRTALFPRISRMKRRIEEQDTHRGDDLRPFVDYINRGCYFENYNSSRIVCIKPHLRNRSTFKNA